MFLKFHYQAYQSIRFCRKWMMFTKMFLVYNENEWYLPESL